MMTSKQAYDFLVEFNSTMESAKVYSMSAEAYRKNAEKMLKIYARKLIKEVKVCAD